MAPETVTQAPGNQALDAFDGYDQSVFLQWLEALTDLVHSQGQPGLMDEGTMPIVGGLMYSLVQAAKELGEREAEERR